jgi:hypothetical protein
VSIRQQPDQLGKELAQHAVNFYQSAEWTCESGSVH